MAEDKSPRETWLIPTAVFLGACVQMALIAGWVWYPGLDLISAEFMMRGFWADYLPPRMRCFLYPGMHWKGRFVPYYYATVKLKCYGGEGAFTETTPLNAAVPGLPHTCSKAGHSCLRKGSRGNGLRRLIRVGWLAGWLVGWLVGW